MVYLFLADGFEDIEAVAVVDILRRANISVKTVGIGTNRIISAHGINIEADIIEDEVELNDNVDAVILPGGMPGTTNLFASKIVKDSVNFCANNNKFICAICAAPSILGQMGILSGKKATCYPGFEKYFTDTEKVEDKVCMCDNIITANGPGSAIDFALKIVEEITDKNASVLIGNSMMYY